MDFSSGIASECVKGNELSHDTLKGDHIMKAVIVSGP
jgi:hypothetical protein